MIVQPTNPELAFEHRLFILEEMPKNSICAEVGVLEGTYTQHIMRITKPKKLHLIDPWYERGSWETFQNNKKYFPECDYEIHNVRFETTNFPKEYFDWIYLDNGHKLKESIDQLKVAYKVVKKGGYIIGDDYTIHHISQIIAVDIFRHIKKIEWFEPRNFQFKMRKI